MLTAAITAAIAWILSLFGIKPGPYLVVVAGVVKVIIVLTGLLLGAKAMKKRKARLKAEETSGIPAPHPPPPAPDVPRSL